MATLDLPSATAIVTGASSGIGRAVVLALLGRGTTVAAVGRSLEDLEGLKAAEHRYAGGIRLYKADLAEIDQIEAVSRQIVEAHPKIDILVHSAGVITRAGVAETGIADMDAQYQVNLRAPLLLTQRLLPALLRSRALIVFVNSSAGVVARARVAAYAGTKHGLRAIADSLRDELGPRGIRVLSVFPGQTATPLQAALYAQDGRTFSPERLLQPEDVATMIVSAVCLPETAEVTEIHIRPAIDPACSDSATSSS
jgi:short-subunit dehydrogenase